MSVDTDTLLEEVLLWNDHPTDEPSRDFDELCDEIRRHFGYPPHSDMCGQCGGEGWVGGDSTGHSCEGCAGTGFVADNQKSMSIFEKLRMREMQLEQSLEFLQRVRDLDEDTPHCYIDELLQQVEVLLEKFEKYGLADLSKEKPMTGHRMIVQWQSFPRRGTDMEYNNAQTGVLLRTIHRGHKGHIEGYSDPFFVPGVNVSCPGEAGDAYFVPV